MLEKYRESDFYAPLRKIIESIKLILIDLKKQGIENITVRQIFYQLVSKNIIKNNKKTYLQISTIISKGRYIGELDWDTIVDNSKFLDTPNFFEDINDLLKAALYSYKLDKWKGQEKYIEVWVEKDALRSVVKPIIDKYDVTLCIPGGRESTSNVYKAFQ